MEKKLHNLYDKENNKTKDKPWIFRTYAGHSNPKTSNELFKLNLSKGQTGLSIAFDLPTQCGYSSNHVQAKAEIGKVGVPINSLDDFEILFNQIPIEEMNTSMTINSTSMWLLSLYIALGIERKIDISKLQGTTQNDIIKEYLARGTYIFPPEASLRMIAEMYEYCLTNLPNWNASNICSYHLQEAGATPSQELAFALSTAIGILDLLKKRNNINQNNFSQVVGRISFFVNSGMRFIEEMCKMLAFTEMWDEICKERYQVKEENFRRFRYGVQVNSLGLTAAQPENNAWRILIETLGVVLSKKARCRALQLPAWNEALSLPRPWDQQWSLRLQQILAYETDLLEYPDLFSGSPVIQSKVKELKEEAYKEIEKINADGGIQNAIESGYMKTALVKSMSERVSRINKGEQVVVGLNKWTEGIASPLTSGEGGGIFSIDEGAAKETLNNLNKTIEKRNPERVKIALEKLKESAKNGTNMMPASIECALARVTTGEWSFALREIFGEYKATTGVEGQVLNIDEEIINKIRARVDSFIESKGHRPRILVAKPGLDGHSNGAEMIAIGARHAGFDVIYAGIRLSPEEIANSAVEENVDIVGVSILSGSHLELADAILNNLKTLGVKNEIPVVIGGIIPDTDVPKLKKLGIKEIFTPKDYILSSVISKVMDVLEEEKK